jgi:transposase
MDELPDLERLSVAEKDDLIRALYALVQPLKAEVERLQAKVRELEGERSKDSHNSSNPPSSDGLAKPPVKPDSLRKSGEHPNGGQPGHPGQTLKQVENPDRVLVHLPPAHCPRAKAPWGKRRRSRAVKCSICRRCALK